MKKILSLILVLMFLLPETVPALAPPSGVRDAARAMKIKYMSRNIKDHFHSRVSSEQLKTLEKLAAVLDPTDVEYAITENPGGWMDTTVEFIDETGVGKIRETLEWLDPYISVEIFSESFREHPIHTAQVIKMFADNPERGKWVLKRFGGLAFTEQIKDNLTGTKFALEVIIDPSFPQENIGLWIGPGRLLSLDDVIRLSSSKTNALKPLAGFGEEDLDNLLKVFPLEVYSRSMRNNPYEFVRFLEGVAVMGTGDFLELITREIKLSEEFEKGFIKRFEAGADKFLQNYTGLDLWQIVELYKEWKEDKYGLMLDYYRRILQPQSGKPNWDQLRDELKTVYRIPFKSVPCRVQVVTPAMFDPSKRPSVKRLVLSVVFDPVELDNLERKGIVLSQPELGSIQMVMKGKTLIMTEIQNHWVARNERDITPHLIRKYHSWPVIAMLALEDYARRHGFTEIIIPGQDYIYRRYGIVRGRKEKKEFYRELDWLYEELPGLLGYEPKKIPAQPLDDGLLELLFNKFHRKDLTAAPLSVLQTYRSLLNPDRFFNTLKEIAQKKEPARKPPYSHLQTVVKRISGVITGGESEGVSPAKLRERIRRAWADAGYTPQTLHWNYSFDDPRGRRFYGISLGGNDLVFEVDLKKHVVVSDENQRYPVLIPFEAIKPLNVREKERLKYEGRMLDGVLREWQIGKLSPHIPLLMKWGKEFGRDKTHRQFIAREYIEALGELFNSLPRDVSPIMLDEILKSFDKKMKGTRDSNKVEVLRVSGLLIRNILDDSRDIEWVKKQVDTLLAVELDMLRSTLPVAAKALKALPSYEGPLDKYLDGAQWVTEQFKENKGRQREGLVFYTVGCLTGSREKPRLPDELLKLYSKLPSKTPLALKEDILEYMLMLKDKGDPAREVLLRLCGLALKERELDPEELNRVLGSLVIICQELASSEYKSFVEKLTASKKLTSMIKICNEKLAAIKRGNVMQATYPKADLLQDLMDGMRRSPTIKLGGVLMRVQANLDNTFENKVAEITLYPTDKAKRTDPALELLDFGFAGEFKEAPRGAIGKIHVALAEIEGETALVVLQRQASQGYWRLVSGVSGTDKRNAYRNYNRELLKRIVDVAGQNPEIDKVICLGEEEAGRLVGERVSKDVVSEFYGLRSYMREKGFREENLPGDKKLRFSQSVAFGTGNFQGPFHILDLKPVPLKVAKKPDDETKAYLDLYTQREMNPVIREAFEETGRYAALAEGVIEDGEDASIYGRFGLGELVTKAKDRVKWLRMGQFTDYAKHLMKGDKRYPFKLDMFAARVVAVEGLPYDGHYGTGGPERDIPTAYIPWDVFEYLYERWEKADPNAVYELGDLIFHEITEPILTKKIMDEENIPMEEARNKAHWLVVDRKGMLSDELRAKFTNARVKLMGELLLRQKASKAGTFGERLRLVREARGLKSKELASMLGTTSEEVSRWENNKNLPAPKYTGKLTAVLDFPGDILLYRKPMYVMLRDPELTPVDRLNIVRMIKGLSWEDIGKPGGKRISEKKIAEYVNKLGIDMNLVMYGKGIDQILDEISRTVPWRQRLGTVLKHMLLAKGLTMDDVARKSGMNAEALRNYVRRKDKHYAKASYIPLIAWSIGIPADTLIFARPLNEELSSDPLRGSRLRKARLAKGLTVEQVRREAKLGGKVQYNKIENDVPAGRDLSASQRARVAAALDVDGGLLFRGIKGAHMSESRRLDGAIRGFTEFELAS
ncbi:helix-turn-helix domain-containing protein [Candidatus Auribacterota bacterium]